MTNFKKIAALWVVGCIAGAGAFAEGEGTWKVSGFVNAGVDVGITEGDAEGFVSNNEDYDGDSHTTATVTYEKGAVTATGKIVLNKKNNDYTFDDSDFNIAAKVGDVKAYIGAGKGSPYVGVAYSTDNYGAEAKIGTTNTNLLDLATYAPKANDVGLKKAVGYFNIPLAGGKLTLKSGTGNTISLEDWNTPGPFEFQAGEDDSYDFAWNVIPIARAALLLKDVGLQGLSLGIVTSPYSVGEFAKFEDFRKNITAAAKYAGGPLVVAAGYGIPASDAIVDISGTGMSTTFRDYLYFGGSFNAGPLTAMLDGAFYGVNPDLHGKDTQKDTNSLDLGVKVAFSTGEGKGKFGADVAAKMVNLIHHQGTSDDAKDGTVKAPVGIKYFITDSALAKLGLELGLGIGDATEKNATGVKSDTWDNYFEVKPQFYFFPGEIATDDIDNDVAKTGFYVALPIKFGTSFADGASDADKAPTVALQLRFHWAF